MMWIFILWAKLVFGFCAKQELAQPLNPLEGYSIQEKHTSQTITDINYNPVDSEEDSEDSDDETDSACMNRENQASINLHFPQSPVHVFSYQDRLSQAYLKPIHTPPDTHTKC
jgi:hypothetical protein